MLAFDWPERIDRYPVIRDVPKQQAAFFNSAIRNAAIALVDREVDLMEKAQCIDDGEIRFARCPEGIIQTGGFGSHQPGCRPTMAGTTPALCFLSEPPRRKLVAFIREALSFYDGSVKTSRCFFP